MMFPHLTILVWRNFLLRFRNWEALVIEIGFPVMLFNLLVYRCSSESWSRSEGYPPFKPPSNESYPPQIRVLYYLPDTAATRQFMSRGSDSTTPRTIPIAKLSDVLDDRSLVVKLHFDDQNTVPKHLRFQVVTRRPYSTHKVFDPMKDRLDSNVFAAQYIIPRMFVNYWRSRGYSGDSCNHSRLTTTAAADENDQGVKDGQVDDSATVGTSHLLLNVTEVELSDEVNSHDRFVRLIFPFYFIGLVCFTAQALIQDKKSGAKYLMTNNGLTAVTYWVSWFVPSFAIGSFTGLLFALAYSLDFDGPGGLTLRRPFLVSGFMLLYTADTVTFSCMIACFVKKTRHSFIIGGTVFIIARFTAPLLQRYVTGRFAVHLMGCVVHQTAVVLFDLLMVEDRRVNGRIYGLYILYAFYEPLSEFSLVDPFIMVMTNTFFNLSVTYYMENIQSGQRSLLKHWLFLMRSRLYLPEEFALYMQSFRKDSDMFEPTTPSLIPSIKLRNVKKVYTTDVVLDIAKLDAFQDEITVILGLNGSGKTTTLNLIAESAKKSAKQDIEEKIVVVGRLNFIGQEKASEGTVVVNGYDISKNPKKVAECIAICPDEKLFMTRLTCKEHLQVYTMKGSWQPSVKSAESLLKSIGMERYSDTYTSRLSPGQRRKLCIALAFTGNKRVVLLDDPFCGLDPAARRDIWQFLKAKRLFRTVLLTTQSAEDAQAVGDRILVMSQGVIKSKGAPDSINKVDGCSFKLNIIRSADCEVKAVTAVINNHVHDAKISEKTETTLQFLIPDKRTSKLPEMLRELESKQESLNIYHFDVLSTSMRDTWLGLHPLPVSPAKSAVSTDRGEGASHVSSARETKGEGEEDQADIPARPTQSVVQQAEAEKFGTLVDYERLVGYKQWFRQIKVIMSMKSVVFVRNKYSSIMILSIPVAYTLLGMMLDSRSKPKPRADPVFFTPESLSSSGLMFPVLLDNQTNSSVMNNYIDLVKRYGNVVNHHIRLIHTSESLLRDPLQWLTDTYTPEQLVKQVPYTVAHVLRHDESEQLAVYCVTNKWSDKPIVFQLLITAWAQCALGGDFSVQSGVQYDGGGGGERPRRPHPWNNGTVLFSVMFMALIPLPFIYSLILEQKHGSKRLQILNGVNPWLYWAGQFLFDLTYYGIMVIPHLVALFFSSDHNWWMLSVWVISVYGLSMFSNLYALQFFFRQPVTGVSFVLMVNIFIGILGALVLKSDLFHEDNTLLQGENFYLDILCRIATPSYELTFFLQLAAYISDRQGYQVAHDYAATIDEHALRVPNFLNQYLMSSFIHMTMSWAVVIFCELGLQRRVCYWLTVTCQQLCTAPAETNSAPEDVAVGDERTKVVSALDSANSIILRNVTKRWRPCQLQTCSVCDVSAHAPAGECLGLLGPNGAGKSLILQMIAGMETLTSGDIEVNGISVKSQPNSVYPVTSYCPQNVPLVKRLTGRETLVFFARLKGVPHDSIQEVVTNIVYFVELSTYETLLVKYYSESSKRKLLLGICMLGVPQFLLLDNPTCNIDILARRKIWTVLDMIRERGRTVVLGSSSSEDCEVLCSRVAIMMDGRVDCLDVPNDYLSKQGRGFIVTIHPKNDGDLEGRRISLDDAQQFVLSALPEAEVLTKQNEFIEIHILDTALLSDVFETLIKAKLIRLIGRYTVQRLSLDHVKCNPKVDTDDPGRSSTLVE